MHHGYQLHYPTHQWPVLIPVPKLMRYLKHLGLLIDAEPSVYAMPPELRPAQPTHQWPVLIPVPKLMRYRKHLCPVTDAMQAVSAMLPG